MLVKRKSKGYLQEGEDQVVLEGQTQMVNGGGCKHFIFYRTVNMHKGNNYIHSLSVDNGTTSEENVVPKIIYSYFKNIFGKQMRFRFRLKDKVWRDDHELSNLIWEFS